ncbi:MAG TPA: IMP dehydrogenase [archaeon]|nr:IMP dehydrogenase [archaeon]
MGKAADFKLGLTFDDVLLEPGASSVSPSNADLRTKLTKTVSLNIPIISAAMDTVTEFQTAIAMAQQGGLGIIHKNMSIEEQAAHVEKVKRAEFLVVTNPITINPNTTIGEINNLMLKYNVRSFPVVENEKLVGLVTNRDLLFEENENKKAKEIMTKDLITASQNTTTESAKKILHTNKIEKLPLVDSKGHLKGLITITDIENIQKYPHANKDKKGRLVVGASIGPHDEKRIEALLDKEVDALVLDTSHGHRDVVIEAVKRYKKQFKVSIIAGNVATYEGTKALIKAGADAVKVGLGPGAICTTRVIAGVGVPQITAVMEAARAAKGTNVTIISDGGIKYSGDIVKALAAGADSVMIGSLLAGCEETPGKVIYMNSRKFKQYRGMGSLGAMEKGSKERYFQSNIRQTNKLVPEGIEGVVPYRGTIAEVIYQLTGGLRAGMGLTGAKTIADLKKKKMMRITDASLKEGHPHDVTITEEAPNYSTN